MSPRKTRQLLVRLKQIVEAVESSRTQAEAATKLRLPYPQNLSILCKALGIDWSEERFASQRKQQ